MPEEQKMHKPQGATLSRAEMADRLRALRSHGEKAAAIAARLANPEIGDVMKDGTIYAGISPTTKQPMYAAPTDAPLTMEFNDAAEYASTLEIGGKQDFRVPDKEELNVLFKNRKKGAPKGTFNLTGSFDGGCYWSSSESEDAPSAEGQMFKDGSQSLYSLNSSNAVRCVR